jgi:hypothetical protein
MSAALNKPFGERGKHTETNGEELAVLFEILKAEV